MPVYDKSAAMADMRRSPLYSDGGQFVLRLILIYAFWKLFFYVAHYRGSAIYTTWHDFVTYTACIYVKGVTLFMGSFEQRVSADGIWVVVRDCRMEVAEHCLGLPAMFVFSMSILFFRGIWWQKLLFIVAGLLGIVLINMFRIFFVVEAFMRLSKYFYQMHHSVIYVVLTYGFILLMIDRWMTYNTRAEMVG